MCRSSASHGIVTATLYHLPLCVGVDASCELTFKSYEVDHLATFGVTAKQRHVKSSEGLERLKEMESTTGVWAMTVVLKIDIQQIVVMDKATQKVLITVKKIDDDGENYLTLNSIDSVFIDSRGN